jgi:uncharacterized protein (DUF433 family)
MSHVYHPYITINLDIMSGSPCFRGTRVPVWTVFDNLADGVSLDEIYENWPTLKKADVEAVIKLAGQVAAAQAA